MEGGHGEAAQSLVASCEASAEGQIAGSPSASAPRPETRRVADDRFIFFIASSAAVLRSRRRRGAWRAGPQAPPQGSGSGQLNIIKIQDLTMTESHAQ